MRTKWMVFIGICVLYLCGGCGQESAQTAEDAAVSDEADALQESEESLVTDEEDEAENDRSLTEEELAEYTEWIQESSNYGFLLSDWDDPTQIDLYEVFYTGAGIAREGTEEEEQAFMERYDQSEIYLDFYAIDKADVNALLLEKVGLTYDELVVMGSEGMEEAYYAETDSFCAEYGDTNYCEFVCTDGEISEEGTIVTLYCDGDDWVSSCEVTLNVAADYRMFLCNHITDGLILETDDTYMESDDIYTESDDTYNESDDEYYDDEYDDEYYDDEYYDDEYDDVEYYDDEYYDDEYYDDEYYDDEYSDT